MQAARIFFEKKKQKTFVHLALASLERLSPGLKVLTIAHANPAEGGGQGSG
jgi:hypothetical protein